jgi:hypothetical protein
MALSFWQKLRVAFRGWSRRREEERADFVRKNTGWGSGAPPTSAAIPPNTAAEAGGAPQVPVDVEGLQVAYLDDSGQISYFLDTMTGEVVEVRNRPAPPGERFKRVPARTPESDADDRRAFLQSLDDSAAKQSLAARIESAEFRQALSADRTIERAWYNFRNERATRTIEQWLQTLGLKAPGRG